MKFKFVKERLKMVLKSIHLLYLDITMVNYNRMLRISFNPELQTQDSLGDL